MSPAARQGGGPASPSRRDRGRSRLNDGFVDRGAPAARCRRPELGRFVAGGATWPNGETVLAGLLHVVLLAMALAESTRHAGLGALPAAASRKPRLAGRRDHRVVLAPMPRAMSGVDPGLAALEAAARRPPPGPPVDACGPDAGLMARAVGPAVGGDSASDATAAGPAHASGLSLAPVASERDAEGRTVPRPVAR